jgi:hypothetical protein
MSEAVKACTVPIYRWETVFTNPRTPAKRGRTWVCAMVSKLRKSRSTRETPTAFLWQWPAIPTVRMKARDLPFSDGQDI